MRKIWVSIVLLIGTLIVCLAGQTSKTYGFLDGNYWNQIGNLKSVDAKIAKLMFVTGLIEASQTQVACILRGKSPDIKDAFLNAMKADALFIGEVKVGITDQMISGLDEVYQDHANKNLPIVGVLSLVVKKIQGEISEQVFADVLRKFRAITW